MGSHHPHSCRCSGAWRRSYRLGSKKETFQVIEGGSALLDGDEAAQVAQYDARRIEVDKALSAEGGKAASQPFEITGTWDFKWPQTQVIRVAFQAHPLLTADVRDHVRRLAEQWTLNAGAPRTSVQFWFDPEPFPAPRNPETNGSTSPAERTPRNYDVLLSLAPLPTFEAETPGDPEVEIDAATSQLGTYALRSDYGVPTTYLGCPEGLGDSGRSEAERVRAYFGSDLFKYVVTHEFGHILGLPHEHQNPNSVLPWAAPAEIRTVMKEVWGLPDDHSLLTDEYIESEITLRWPGGTRFSNWRSKEKTVPYQPSIMAHALLRHFFDPKSPHYAAPSRAGDLYAAALTAPTEADLEHLADMYPYRGSGRQKAAAE